MYDRGDAGISQNSTTKIVSRNGQIMPMAEKKNVRRLIQQTVKSDLEQCNDCTKQIIYCVKRKRKELSEYELVDVSVFYWASFYGLNKYVRYMILNRKWSPFIKAYRNRSIISGAIWGSKTETVRMMLANYKFEGFDQTGLIDFARSLFNKDKDDNNCLHYCYMIDLPEVRQLLRDNQLFDIRSQRLNRRGQLPSQLRHFVKAENSDIDTEDEDCYEKQEAVLMSDPALVIQGTSL